MINFKYIYQILENRSIMYFGIKLMGKTLGGMEMKKYIITTDNNADLPESFYKEHDLGKIYLSYVVNDIEYDGVEKSMTSKEFYDAMREGAMPSTQQVNPENSRVFFENIAKEGFDILHIAFTSGLSGTYSSTTLGAEEAMEAYPDVKITVIDSLCASMGQGLLLHEAIKRKDAGMEYDALIQWIEDNKLRLIHEVVADDLFHLQRGGRVSKTAAVLGSTLGVKPIIHVNSEGKLISYTKQRHKSGGLKFLANNLVKYMQTEDALTTVGISHSDCLADAEKLAAMIREKTDVEHIIIGDIGPTIGAHTGIGTVAVFYFGEDRTAHK